MKYKVGDKVVIKNREDMSLLDGKRAKSYYPEAGGTSFICFSSLMEKTISKLNDRVTTVTNCMNYNDFEFYRIKDNDYAYTDEMIECSFKDYKEKNYKPINNRWELLDL